MAFQHIFILEQQIFCVYSGMACGLRTLGVRSPVLSKRGRYTGTWAGRVCLGAGPSSVGNLAVVFKSESLPALPLCREHRCLSSNHRWSRFSLILDFARDTSVCGPLPALPQEEQMGRGWWITRRLRTKILFNYCFKVHLRVSGEMPSIPGTAPMRNLPCPQSLQFPSICFHFSLPLQSNKESTWLTSTPLSLPFVLVAFLAVAAYVQLPAFKEEIAHLGTIWNLSLFLLRLSLRISNAKRPDGLDI